MQDVFKYIECKEKKYPLVFNINVLMGLQEKLGLERLNEILSSKEDAALEDPKLLEDLITLVQTCINEGIDMENDSEDAHYVKRDIPRPFLTSKQTARVVGAILNNGEFSNLLVESNDSGEEEKNVMTKQSPTE